MFYKARSKETGAMWDVWMTHHGGLYYLYLACDTKTDDRGANNVSLATSPDGVHWTEVGPVIVRDEGKKFLGSGPRGAILSRTQRRASRPTIPATGRSGRRSSSRSPRT